MNANANAQAAAGQDEQTKHLLYALTNKHEVFNHFTLADMNLIRGVCRDLKEVVEPKRAQRLNDDFKEFALDFVMSGEARDDEKGFVPRRPDEQVLNEFVKSCIYDYWDDEDITESDSMGRGEYYMRLLTLAFADTNHVEKMIKWDKPFWFIDALLSIYNREHDNNGYDYHN